MPVENEGGEEKNEKREPYPQTMLPLSFLPSPSGTSNKHCMGIINPTEEVRLPKLGRVLSVIVQTPEESRNLFTEFRTSNFKFC